MKQHIYSSSLKLRYAIYFRGRSVDYPLAVCESAVLAKAVCKWLNKSMPNNYHYFVETSSPVLYDVMADDEFLISSI